MKSKRIRPPQRKLAAQQVDWTPEGLGLGVGRYKAVVSYLFDRPVPQGQEQEWYWADDLEVFVATSLEWTRFQAAIFANATTDLATFSNEQVGMGLNYLMSNSVSDVPYAAINETVPLDEAMRMMRAMPLLWRGCIGPRLASDRSAIGFIEGRLGYVCHMWFDVWPTYTNVSHVPAWTDAVWHVLSDMLTVPCRAVQIAALHGIGHEGGNLDRWSEINAAVDAFLTGLAEGDEELRNYAEAARTGNVQ
jgi:hypothetical protein